MLITGNFAQEKKDELVDIKNIEGEIDEDKAKALLGKLLYIHPYFAVYLLTGRAMFPFQWIKIKMMFERDFVLDISARGGAKCIDPEALVFTDRGLLPIKDARIGDKILAKDNWQEVTNYIKNPLQKGRKITTTKNYEVKGKLGHKTLVFNPNTLDLEYRNIEDIREGDYIPTQYGMDKWLNRNIIQEFLNNRVNKGKQPLNLDNIQYQDLYWLLGLCLADGTYDGKHVGICSGLIETQDWMCQFLKKIMPENSIGRHRRMGSKAVNIRIVNENFRELIEFLGFKINSYSPIRTLPEKIFLESRENICAFLSGCFDGDGCVTLNRVKGGSYKVRIDLSSSSRELLKQIRCLLNNIGITSDIRHSFKAQKNFLIKGVKCNAKDSYRLSITGRENIQAFYKNIGFRISYKKETLEKGVLAWKTQESYYDKLVPVGEFLKKEYQINTYNTVSRPKIRKIAKYRRIKKEHKQKLEKLANEKWEFLRVNKIEEIKTESIDVTVDQEQCFWADGFIHHNTSTAAFFVLLHALFNPGIKILCLAPSLKQSVLILSAVNDLIQLPNAHFIRQIIDKSDFKRSSDRVSLFIGSRGGGKISEVFALPLGTGCLALDSMITTDSGIKEFRDFIPQNTDLTIPIQEFTQPNCKVWSYKGYKESDQQFYNGIKETTIITTKCGFQVESTLNHKFKVLGKNGAIEWRKSSDIRVGDSILIDASKRWHSNDTDISLQESYSLGGATSQESASSIPQVILNSSKEKVEEFLKGFSPLGDTALTLRPFTHKSEKIIRQIQYILLHFGIVRQFCKQGDLYSIDLSLEGEVKASAIKNGIYIDTVAETECSFAATADMHIPDGHEYCANGFFSHNTKIRGARAQVIIIDEAFAVPEVIIDEVIAPMMIVNADIDERRKVRAWEDNMIKAGAMKVEDRKKFKNNKLIMLSSACFEFEALCKRFNDYVDKITDPLYLQSEKYKESGVSFGIINFGWEVFPDDLLQRGFVLEQKSKLPKSSFRREYEAQFAPDSDSYFKPSSMAKCTIPIGEHPSIELKGDSPRQYGYILAIDPNYKNAENSDHFAMCLMKFDREHLNIGYVVHNFAAAGVDMNNTLKYIKYLIKFFNIEYIIIDSGGGHNLLSTINNSKIFQEENIELSEFEADFSDPESIEKAKESYNKTARKIIHFQNFTSSWIRDANEHLQVCFEHRKVRFASMPVDDDYNKLCEEKIPIDDLIFRIVKKEEGADQYTLLNENDRSQSRKIDLIDHQNLLIDLIKEECANIQVTITSQGNQTFDLPQNMKRMIGPDRPRKDSYSALLLAAWGLKCYGDLQSAPEQADHYANWMPPVMF